MLVIRDQQLGVFGAILDEQLVQVICVELRRRYPRTVAAWSDEALRTQVVTGLREADDASVAPDDRKWFAMARVLLGTPLRSVPWGVAAIARNVAGLADTGPQLLNTLLLHVDLED